MIRLTTRQSFRKPNGARAQRPPRLHDPMDAPLRGGLAVCLYLLHLEGSLAGALCVYKDAEGRGRGRRRLSECVNTINTPTMIPILNDGSNLYLEREGVALPELIWGGEVLNKMPW